jgi:N-6 DNA Methylase
MNAARLHWFAPQALPDTQISPWFTGFAEIIADLGCSASSAPDRMELFWYCDSEQTMSGAEAFSHIAKDFLARAGYHARHVVDSYDVSFPAGATFDRLHLNAVGFSDFPHTMRTACIAVADAEQSGRQVHEVLSALRYLSAPVAVLRTGGNVQLWAVRQRPAGAPIAQASSSNWAEELSTRAAELSPENIAAAKTGQRQLYFVDADLQRWAMQATEQSLRDILSRALDLAMQITPLVSRNGENRLITLVFQLFASRVLQDKAVIERTEVPADALKQACEAYPRCFSATIPIGLRESAAASYALISQSYDYSRVNSEMLGYVYENTLVSAERRGKQGIYYTPQSIASYVLDSLPIETIAQPRRYIYDPCCGSGSFLLAAFNRLNSLLPDKWTAPERHRYLQERLMGADADAFAVGIARLSLVLADSTTRDGWNIEQRDVLEPWSKLETLPRIVVTNPPFKEIKHGSRRELSTEILHHVIDELPNESLMGIVLPTSALESSSGAAARDAVLKTCNVIELDLFPGGLFESQAETSIWLLRKCPASERRTSVMVRELKNADVLKRFVTWREFSRSYPADQSAWHHTKNNAFQFSPLADLWDMLAARGLPTLGDVATINAGLQVFKNDSDRVSKRKRAGDKRYVSRLTALKPFCFLPEHDAHPYQWIDYDIKKLRRKSFSEMFEHPKVLMNSNRNPASAWRIVAAVAREPVYFSDNFHGVSPKAEMPLEVLAAVLNSHVANAWLDAHSRKRKLVIDTLKRIPFPDLSARDSQRLTDAVRSLEHGIATHAEDLGGLFDDSEIDSRKTANLLMEIDEIVFTAYGLVSDEMRRVERFMSVDRRPG